MIDAVTRTDAGVTADVFGACDLPRIITVFRALADALQAGGRS